jgi:ribose 5-phosphate isomerase B
MLYIAADHQGRLVLNELLAFLDELQQEYEVVGKELYTPEDDYPDFAKEVVVKVLEDKENKGILLCGSGQGMVIAANRFKGIRCGICWNEQEATLARSDDDINGLSLSRYLFENENWKDIVAAFLNTEFKNEEKYIRRRDKLDLLG